MIKIDDSNVTLFLFFGNRLREKFWFSAINRTRSWFDDAFSIREDNA